MKYVLSVKAKYLQMLVAYNIYMKKPNQVTLHFEQFNQDFGEMCLAFKEITCQVFLPFHPLSLLINLKQGWQLCCNNQSCQLLSQATKSATNCLHLLLHHPSWGFNAIKPS